MTEQASISSMMDLLSNLVDKINSSKRDKAAIMAAEYSIRMAALCGAVTVKEVAKHVAILVSSGANIDTSLTFGVIEYMAKEINDMAARYGNT